MPRADLGHPITDPIRPDLTRSDPISPAKFIHQQPRQQRRADVEQIDVLLELAFVVAIRFHPPPRLDFRAPVGNDLVRRERRRRADRRRCGTRVGVELPQRVAEMVEIDDGQAAAAAVAAASASADRSARRSWSR